MAETTPPSATPKPGVPSGNRVFGGIVLGLGLVLVGRAAELQLSSRSEREAAHLTAERTRTMHVAAHRGRLLDAHGRVLAEDRVEHDVAPVAAHAPTPHEVTVGA